MIGTSLREERDELLIMNRSMAHQLRDGITIKLSPDEINYIKQFNAERKKQPLTKKALAMPSIQIFLKIAEQLK